MRSIQRVIIFTAVILFPLNLWSLTVSLAPLYQYNPDGSGFKETDITEDLYRSLRRNDREGIIKIRKIKGKDVPKSILDAAGLMRNADRKYLLYGFLKVTEDYYDLEIKLYDADGGRIQKIFYAKDGTDGYENLVEVMTERILAYFDDVFGVTERKHVAEKEHGITAIETGGGYWFPVGGWRESLLGLGSVRAGWNLTPVMPLFRRDIFTFALCYGLSLEYAPGMNREGYESFFLHTLRFGFPVTLSALWYERNRILVRVIPGMEYDLMIQDRKYGGTVTERSTAFSLGGSIGYEYLFTGKKISAGGMIFFNTAFYRTVFMVIEPELYIRYRMK